MILQEKTAYSLFEYYSKFGIKDIDSYNSNISNKPFIPDELTKIFKTFKEVKSRASFRYFHIPNTYLIIRVSKSSDNNYEVCYYDDRGKFNGNRYIVCKIDEFIGFFNKEFGFYSNTKLEFTDSFLFDIR